MTLPLVDKAHEFRFANDSDGKAIGDKLFSRQEFGQTAFQ